MKLIVPNVFVEEENLGGPLIFTAGPIRAGGNWQQRFVEQAATTRPDLVVACPGGFKLSEINEEIATGPTDRFVRQTAWERHFIGIALRTGCLMFWVPCEDPNNRRKNGSYGQGTRDELGEYRAHKFYNPEFRIVVGVEPGFPGRGPTVYSFKELLGDEFPIYETYEDTVQAAFELAF